MIKGAKYNLPPDNKGRWMLTDDHTIHRKFEPEKDSIGDVRVRYSTISYAGAPEDDIIISGVLEPDCKELKEPPFIEYHLSREKRSDGEYIPMRPRDDVLVSKYWKVTMIGVASCLVIAGLIF
jgi:hypothetical protein